MSLRLRLLRLLARMLVKPRLRRAQDPAKARRDFAKMIRRLPAPPFLLHRGRGEAIHEITAGPVSDRAIVLWLHGGAYLMGGPDSHERMLGRLSRLSGLRVLVPVYRLAPQHPAPAAFEDACAAHTALMLQGWRPEQIILGGDSAGGGLALALLADLCRRDLRPAALVALSPWTDLTLGGASLVENAARDPLLPAERISFLTGLVLAGFPADDPRVSPLWAQFDRPPPVLIQVGSDEILLDDATRMAGHLRRSGAEVTLEICDKGLHVWHFFDGWLPEARVALRSVARFCKAHAPPEDTSR